MLSIQKEGQTTKDMEKTPEGQGETGEEGHEGEELWKESYASVCS